MLFCFCYKKPSIKFNTWGSYILQGRHIMVTLTGRRIIIYLLKIMYDAVACSPLMRSKVIFSVRLRWHRKSAFRASKCFGPNFCCFHLLRFKKFKCNSAGNRNLQNHLFLKVEHTSTYRWKSVAASPVFVLWTRSMSICHFLERIVFDGAERTHEIAIDGLQQQMHCIERNSNRIRMLFLSIDFVS